MALLLFMASPLTNAYEKHIIQRPQDAIILFADFLHAELLDITKKEEGSADQLIEAFNNKSKNKDGSFAKIFKEVNQYNLYIYNFFIGYKDWDIEYFIEEKDGSKPDVKKYEGRIAYSTNIKLYTKLLFN